jgi:rare lipoprotein A
MDPGTGGTARSPSYRRCFPQHAATLLRAELYEGVQLKRLIKKTAAWSAAAGCAALFTGCASTQPDRAVPIPAPAHRNVIEHPGVKPIVPPAGSGLGAYYQNDGPGIRTPPRLERVPDAVFRDEPPAKIGNRPYSVFGQKYIPLQPDEAYTQEGVASWYGVKFHGRRTSSGERYDMYKMTAAHPTLPIPSYVRVTNLETGKQVVVRINDRGPFLSNRLIDVSYTAALKLGLLKKGRMPVRLDRIMASDSVKTAAVNERVALETEAP